MLDKLLDENDFLAVFFCKPIQTGLLKSPLTLLAFRREGWHRERSGVGSAREYRQWDGESGHNVRENVRLPIRAEVGCHKTTRARLLPETISQHLPRRSQIRGWRLGLAAEEPVPSARAKHLHLRSVGHRCGFCRLYRVPVAMFQATTAASTTPQAKLKGLRSRFSVVTFHSYSFLNGLWYHIRRATKLVSNTCVTIGGEVICIWTTLWRQQRGWNGQCMYMLRIIK